MNKAQLIEAVASKLGSKKTEAVETLDVVLGTIIEATVEEGECVIPGLGKLVVTETAARKGNTNGVAWSKPAGETIKLRLSSAGKELV